MENRKEYVLSYYDKMCRYATVKEDINNEYIIIENNRSLIPVKKYASIDNFYNDLFKSYQYLQAVSPNYINYIIDDLIESGHENTKIYNDLIRFKKNHNL